MWFEPGPFALRDPFPVEPPIVRPGTFARRLDDTAPTLLASDHVLSAAQRDVATVNDAGLDAIFVTTIDAAETIVDANANAADDLTADALLANGANGDALRDSVQSYLPSPDTPITMDFTEPPIPYGPPNESPDHNEGPPGPDVPQP